ncbi:unnamed protein product [Caenorhabditis angaria]|uniref:ATP citrate synthase n=1 Tax=Caenorhabditis angaria TaxID=860376 RepID=A0A9P1J1A6_9PELO|nr:unnamed protein product [Caenorhabditis angaria]
MTLNFELGDSELENWKNEIFMADSSDEIIQLWRDAEKLGIPIAVRNNMFLQTVFFNFCTSDCDHMIDFLIIEYEKNGSRDTLFSEFSSYISEILFNENSKKIINEYKDQIWSSKYYNEIKNSFSNRLSENRIDVWCTSLILFEDLILENVQIINTIMSQIKILNPLPGCIEYILLYLAENEKHIFESDESIVVVEIYLMSKYKNIKRKMLNRKNPEKYSARKFFQKSKVLLRTCFPTASFKDLCGVGDVARIFLDKWILSFANLSMLGLLNRRFKWRCKNESNLVKPSNSSFIDGKEALKFIPFINNEFWIVQNGTKRTLLTKYFTTVLEMIYCLFSKMRFNGNNILRLFGKHEFLQYYAIALVHLNKTKDFNKLYDYCEKHHQNRGWFLIIKTCALVMAKNSRDSGKTQQIGSEIQKMLRYDNKDICKHLQKRPRFHNDRLFINLVNNTVIMSSKAISELSGKEILYKYFEGTGLVNSPYAFHVKAGDDFNQVAGSYEWLTKAEKGIIKLDQLIKRCKGWGLSKIGSPEELCNWFERNVNRHLQMSNSIGFLHTFIVEPFCEHQEFDKMYIAITSNKEEDTLMFFKRSGSDIGNVESKARFLKIAVEVDNNAMSPTDEQLDTLVGVELPNFEVVKKFVDVLYRAYKELHFTYLEINPFVYVNNQIHILDLAAKLDETANFICSDKWRSRHTPMSAPIPLRFPAPFGRVLTEEERLVADFDDSTGTPLTILNRNSYVHTLCNKDVEVIAFKDAFYAMGRECLLASSGEYSDDSSVLQVYNLANKILSIMTAGKPKRDGKVFVVGGSISNFSNGGQNFEGISKAIQQYIPKLKEHKVKVYVRRGGPNYQEGLRCLKDAAAKLNFPVRVFGPETDLTAISGELLMGINMAERQPALPEPTSTEVEPLDQSTFRGLLENGTKAIIWGHEEETIQGMLEYDLFCRRDTPSVVASTYPFTGDNTQKYNFGQKEVLIPAYKSMAKACATHPEATVLGLFASKKHAYEVAMEALEFPQLKVIVIIAEGVPENQTRKLLKVAAERGVTLIGPATTGAIKPGCIRIGNSGDSYYNTFAYKLSRPGSVAYVSRSGGMCRVLNNIISQNSDGVYEGIAIGGDRYSGSTYVEHIARYQADDRVKMIVLLGEVGGTEEYKIVDMLNRGEITKPLVAWCIGISQDKFCDFTQSASCKNAALHGAGAIVPSSFEELGNNISETYECLVAHGTIVPSCVFSPPLFPKNCIWERELGLIRKKASTSSFADDLGGTLYFIGVDCFKMVNIGDFIGSTWFEKSLPAYANSFLEKVVLLSIIAARDDRDTYVFARRDICRFGGDIDGAARQFSNAMDNGWSPMQFVNEMEVQNKDIMGIGHRRRNINMSRKNVEILKKIALNRSKFTQETPLLEFALEVEKITTAKKSNLSLNVDGIIGVILVDILRQSKLFTPAEAQQIIESDTLNSLLVIGRRICVIKHYLE